MALQTGVNWDIHVDTAEDKTTPVWVKLGNQTSGTFEVNRSSLDTTNKDNSGHEDEVSYRKGWTMSCEGHADHGDPGLLYLIDTNHFDAAIDKPAHIKWENEDGDTFIGWCTIESISHDFAESSIVTFSASFKGRARANDGTVDLLAVTRV